MAHRYRLDRVVGEGGMGVVWAATHVLTEKPCALKFLKGGRAADPRSHARLLHEARATCRVRHPNVAPVHDILELPNGVPFIVMDLLDGEPLSARLRRGSLDWKETLAILAPTADAIMAAHEQGVVHRDLKPDNVFLEKTSDGGYEVKVLDFGIAKRFDVATDGVALADERSGTTTTTTHGLTTTNSMIGTPSYMAPEQIRLDADVGRPADVWMLGMLAFECLTGRRPDRDLLTHGVDAMLAERELEEHGEGVTPASIRFVLDMLQLDPADRPSLAELRVTMRSLRGSTPPPRRSPSLGLVAAFLVVAIGGTAFVVEHVGAKNDATTATTDAPTSAPVTASSAVATTPTPDAIPTATTAAPTTTPSPTSATSATPASVTPVATGKKAARAHVIAEPAPPVPSAAPSSTVTIPSYDRH
ncbi:MAG TPA: serine/threonine-protein kinase [Polyangiaceae bacterium]